MPDYSPDVKLLMKAPKRVLIIEAVKWEIKCAGLSKLELAEKVAEKHRQAETNAWDAISGRRK